MRLTDSVALVTGGASGLGEATVRHLHSRGATVVVADRDAERTDALAAELGCLGIVGDVSLEADAARAVDAARDVGPLRIVVACAGGARQSLRTVGRDGRPHDLDSFVETLVLNAVTTFNALRLAAAAMAALDPVGEDGERGVIVTTSSIAAYEGQIGQIAYGAAKGAIVSMTLIAARDLASVGVRVNCIAPGTIGTRAWDAAAPELRASLASKVPFPARFGHPAEFAELAEHLITNCYMNGQVVRLDGAIRFEPR